MTESRVVFYIYEHNRFLDAVVLAESRTARNESSSVESEKCDLNGIRPRKFAAVFKVDGYFMSVFSRLLNTSSEYSKRVQNNFVNNVRYVPDDREISVKFQLVKPKLEIIDYAWSNRLCYLIFERQELEHAMSWLSTLGGAFSALGDSLEKCAQVAGQISIEQFKIAYRLGEPPLLARCRLYMALSLIQLGKLNTAKKLILEQYTVAKSLNDFRLRNMCKGVWAKLQYTYKEKKNSLKKPLL